MMRLALVLALYCTLAPPCAAQQPDSINVTASVEQQVRTAPLQALCVIRWKDRGAQAFDVIDVVPAPDGPEMARCNGYPVMLVRPVCLVTVPEGEFYAHSTPLLVIRCAPHAQAWRFRGVPFPARQMERS